VCERDEARSWADKSSDAPFSAIMKVGALVFDEVTDGMTEASMTRNRSTPRTRNCSSTTEAESTPMRQLELG
jgi:hypothetical protein